MFALSCLLPLIAVLSPEVEMQREIKAIREAPELRKKIGHQVIKEIRRVKELDNREGYIYEVVTNLSTIRVDVHYLPPLNPKLIGAPQRFELRFYDPVF